MLTGLFLVLLTLWLLGFFPSGNLEFLRAPVFTLGSRGVVTVFDALVAVGVAWVIAAIRGPIAVAAAGLLAVWG